jgi:hypothetical protein
MKAKFIFVNVIEGYSTYNDRALNVDHVVQFEPNMAKAGTCHVYMSDGKVICVACSFEQLIKMFN